jgi:aminoglycoside phosphotransferase (APT) family kinase protein
MYSNKTCLEMMHRAMVDIVIPELDNSHAKVVSNIVVGAIEELIKRETRTPQLLLDRLLTGKELAARMLTLDAAMLLDGDNQNYNLRLERISFGSRDNLQYLLSCHADLTVLLTETAKRVAALRDGRHEPEDVETLNSILYEAAVWEEDNLRLQLEPITILKRFQPTYRPLTAALLQSFIRAQRPDFSDASVANFRAVPGGMSKETFLFDLIASDGTTHELVVRKEARTPIFTMDCFLVGNEFDLLMDVFDAGFLVPEPLMVGRSIEGVDGDLYIMRKVNGSTVGSVFGASQQVSEDILLQLAELFAKLHSIDLSKFSRYISKHYDVTVVNWTVSELIGRELRRWKEYFKTYNRTPSPVDFFVEDWLFRNLPHNEARPVLVHGDMSIHNLLIHDGRISAVLDWEVAHFGDPAEDLSYVREFISSQMDWNKFINRYYEHGGRVIREDSFSYYEVLGYRQKEVAANFMATMVNENTTDDIRNLAIAMEYLPKFTGRVMAPIHEFRAHGQK